MFLLGTQKLFLLSNLLLPDNTDCHSSLGRSRYKGNIIKFLKSIQKNNNQMALTLYENSLKHLAKSISDEIGEETSSGWHEAC